MPDCPHRWRYAGTFLTRGLNEYRCELCGRVSRVKREGRVDGDRLRVARAMPGAGRVL